MVKVTFSGSTYEIVMDVKTGGTRLVEWEGCCAICWTASSVRTRHVLNAPPTAPRAPTRQCAPPALTVSTTARVTTFLTPPA